jgi:hypothetical protein
MENICRYRGPGGLFFVAIKSDPSILALTNEAFTYLKAIPSTDDDFNNDNRNIVVYWRISWYDIA